jgi:hypothetical protein
MAKKIMNVRHLDDVAPFDRKEILFFNIDFFDAWVHDFSFKGRLCSDESPGC